MCLDVGLTYGSHMTFFDPFQVDIKDSGQIFTITGLSIWWGYSYIC